MPTNLELGASVTGGAGVTGIGGGSATSPVYYQGINSSSPLSHLLMPGSNDLANNDGKGYLTFRAPILVTAANGDILAFTCGQDSGADNHSAAIFVMRRTAGVWSGPTLVYLRPDFTGGTAWINLGVVIVQTHTPAGRIHLLFCKADGATPVYTPWYMYSDDNGLTWTGPTEISASVCKADDSNFVGNGGGASVPGTIPAYCHSGGSATDAANSRWNFYAFGPARGVCIANGANVGRLVAPCQHRYTVGSNNCWSHCVYSDNNGSTWILGGGFVEKQINRSTNEGCMAEVGSTGSIYFNCRNVSNAGTLQQWYRGQAGVTGLIADVTAAWSDAKPMLDNNSVNVGVSESAASICPMANGDLFFQCPGDPSLNPNRSRETIWKSTDSGTTWTLQRPIYYGSSGYSGLIAIDGNTLLSVFEKSVDESFASDTAGQSPHGDVVDSNQYIGVATFNRTWLSNPTLYPDVFDFQFNEDANAVATSTVGAQILSHGASGRVMDCRLRGGTSATFNTNGVSFGGSGTGLTLQKLTGTNGVGGAFDPGIGSFTWEWEYMAPAGASKIFFDNRAAVANTIGYTATLDSNSRPSFSLCDGTALDLTVTAPAQGAPNYADGSTYYVISVVYERGVSLRLYSNGVLLATTTPDTQGPAKYIVGSDTFTVGSKSSNNSSALTSGTIIRRMRFTRGAVAVGDLLGANAAKQTPQALHGFDYTASPAGLPTLTGCVLALNTTYNGGPSGEVYGGWDYPAMSASGPMNGQGFGAFRNRMTSPPEFWKTGGSSRLLTWGSDTFFGKFARHSFIGSNSGFLSTFAATANYDFIQKTGNFVILMCARFIGDTAGGYQVMLDNNTAGGGQPGFDLYRNPGSGYGMTFAVYKAGSALFFENTAIQLATSTRYFIGVVGRVGGIGHSGTGLVDYYTKAYPGGLAPPGNLTRTRTAVNFVDPTGAGGATQQLCLGCRNTPDLESNWETKNVHIYNTSDSAANASTDAASVVGSDAFMQKWADFMVQY